MEASDQQQGQEQPGEDPAAADNPAVQPTEGDQGEQVAQPSEPGFDPDAPVSTSGPAPEDQTGTPGQTPGGVNDPDAPAAPESEPDAGSTPEHPGEGGE